MEHSYNERKTLALLFFSSKICCMVLKQSHFTSNWWNIPTKEHSTFSGLKMSQNFFSLSAEGPICMLRGPGHRHQTGPFILLYKWLSSKVAKKSVIHNVLHLREPKPPGTPGSFPECSAVNYTLRSFPFPFTWIFSAAQIKH